MSGFSNYVWYLSSKDSDEFLVYEILIWIVEYVFCIFVLNFLLVLEVVGGMGDLNEVFVFDVMNWVSMNVFVLFVMSDLV